MALPTFPTDDANYIAGLTDEDFLNGGHRTNFPLSLAANLTLIEFSRLSGIEIQTLAEQVALDAQTAEEGSGTEASVANIRAAVNEAFYISMRRVVAANVPVELTDGAPIAWDMATGINFKVTIGAAGRALANPTNQTAGKSGFINVIQDGAGGRSITSWGNNFVWIGEPPYWPTAPGARTKLAYFVNAVGDVELSFAGNSA